VYPLKFEPIYFEKIWGGKHLQELKNNVPEGTIGESWEVSCHKNGVSIVSNGRFKGVTLKEVIEREGKHILGDYEGEDFPLLLKLISTSGKLSVQVHPDDIYGRKIEGDNGKTEAWYVIHAESGATLVLGTRECTKEEFKNAIKNGTLDKYLNIVPVKSGDVFFVNSGLIHAIGEGILLLEIQQNSDITYRVYDYNRGRELHLEKALEVANLKLKSNRLEGKVYANSDYEVTKYVKCPYFSLDLYEIYSRIDENTEGKKFLIYSCIEGEGKIEYSEGEESIIKGESILIPSSLGHFNIVGQLKLIKIYVL